MKKIKGLFIVVAFMGLLTSCSSSFAYVPYEFASLENGSFKQIDYEGYYRQGEYDSLSIGDKTYSSFSSIYRDQAGSSSQSWHLNVPSTGKTKLLVIPMDFSDYKASERLAGNSKEMIEASFFGDDSYSQFYSLASYFDKASYGRLHISGKVSDWFTSNSYTYASLSSISGSSKNAATLASLRNEALSWYDATYPEDPSSNYAFDSNDDGVNDTVPLFLVYAPPSVSSSSSNYRDQMMWAFEVGKPAPTAWAPFELTYLNSEGKVDSHTYIHEYGHMLGLKDYYDVQSSGGEDGYALCSPTGRVDMMDYSIGDETGYSKLLMDWTRPFVPTASTTISLRPFSSSGEMILLAPSSWNKTPYDEYLLLEFYTPYYLNRVDATLRPDDESLFSECGVKLYHVDSRLGYYKTTFMDYVGNIPYSSDYRVDIANDNSASSSSQGYIDNSSLLYQLINASTGSAALEEKYVAKNSSLFQQGDSFSSTGFNLSMHNGSTFDVSFKIEKMTSTYCDISISL